MGQAILGTIILVIVFGIILGTFFLVDVDNKEYLDENKYLEVYGAMILIMAGVALVLWGLFCGFKLLL